jgi:lipid-binding SYLF domain-containing protein
MTMHIMRIFLATTLTLFAVNSATADSYSEAKQVFMNAGESGAYFNNSYGYALFPTIGKGGMGVGGAHGSGQVYVNGAHVGDTKMTQLSIGWQLGGQAYSQIIFFKDKRAFEDFSSGNFEFGAQAAAVAITASAGAGTSTGGGTQTSVAGGKNDATTASLGYSKGMAVFTVAKGGLMYEATLAGQKYSYSPK